MRLSAIHPVRSVIRALNGWQAAVSIPRASRAQPTLAPALRALAAALGPIGDEREMIATIERWRAAALDETASIEVPPKPRLEGDTGVTHPLATSVAGSSVGAKSPFWGRYLFHLVRELGSRTILEMGTNIGISASYLAAAQAENGVGRLVSIEAVPGLAGAATRHLRGLGLTEAEVVVGWFSEVLEPTLRRIAPVDLVFVDGNHAGPSTLAYFEQVRPYLAPDAVVVFDDISWSDGMRSAWRQLREHEAFAATLDLRVMGICFLGGRGERSGAVRIPVYAR